MSSVLNLNDLFDQIQTSVLEDFPSPGQSRIVRFKKISGKDELKRWKLYAKLKKLEAQKGEENPNEEEYINTMDEIYSLSSDLISRYLVGEDNQLLVTVEQALTLSFPVVTALSVAMAEKGKELGEDSAPEGTKENSNDGSTGAQTSAESSMLNN